MKQSVKFFMMILAVAAVSSCVDLNWDEKKQENANNSFFAKMVGRIDPDHTWNLAKEGSVTVSTASPSEIRIFSMSWFIKYLPSAFSFTDRYYSGRFPRFR